MNFVTGVAYYTKEAYAQLLQDADDREALSDTHKEWLETYERARKELKKGGIETLPFVMDMLELKAWCRARGLRNTGESRSMFVSEKMSMRKRPEE